MYLTGGRKLIEESEEAGGEEKMDWQSEFGAEKEDEAESEADADDRVEKREVRYRKPFLVVVAVELGGLYLAAVAPIRGTSFQARYPRRARTRIDASPQGLVEALKKV